MSRGKENIVHRNSKGERHGYYQWYDSNGKLFGKCNHYNDEAVGMEVVGPGWGSSWTKKLMYCV